MSRNKNRVGTQPKDSSVVPPHMLENDSSEGFSFVVPTEFVDLPSQGRFYPEGHPLHGADTIEIKQMTAKEEDILTSRSLLRKGIALDRVIENIIVDKSIDPDSLLVGDRNAIIIATRVSGYGPEYNTKISCPQCGTSQDYNFDLNESNTYTGENIDRLNLTDRNDGTFDVKLPKTQLDIRFRLLNGYDEKFFSKNVESSKKKKGAEQNITQQLARLIVGVNGNETADAINYVVNNLPSLDSRHLRESYKLAAPNIDLKQYFECSECTHEQDLEVPLSADFFWPDR